MPQTSNRQTTKRGEGDISGSLVNNAQNYTFATDFNMNWIAGL